MEIIKKWFVIGVISLAVFGCGAKETNVIYIDSKTGMEIDPPPPPTPALPKMPHFDFSKRWVDVYCVNGWQLAVVKRGQGGYSFWVPNDSKFAEQFIKHCDESTLGYREIEK